MRVSNRPRWVQGSLGVGVAALVWLWALPDSARAYGGLWSEASTPVALSSARVVLVDNPDATVTAIVQLRYQGPAQELAWVIPVPGTPHVEVSSSIVLERLAAATAPRYWLERAIEGSCAGDADGGAGDGDEPYQMRELPPPTESEPIGPYEVFDTGADPSLGDPIEAVAAWLQSHGYEGPAPSAALEPYVRRGYNLLAFKLDKGADATALRPIALTYDSDRIQLPIWAGLLAADQVVGLDVWVFGPSQAVPIRYPSLVLNDARIDWLSVRTFAAGTLPEGGAGPFGAPALAPSNYDAMITAAAQEAEGGFVTELGAPASQYRDKVWSQLDEDTFTTLIEEEYDDGIDAVLAAKALYGGWDGWREAIDAATVLPDGVTAAELASDPERYRGEATVDTASFFEQLARRVVRPVSDAAASFRSAPYLTLLRSVMSAEMLKDDPRFDFNAELAQIEGVHIARQRIACASDLEPDEAPWRIALPQGGVVAGQGGDRWPVRAGSMPASLKVVELSTSGSGTVVKDNSARIAAVLLDAFGTDDGDRFALQPPLQGVLIGGSQSVRGFEPSDPDDGTAGTSGQGCSAVPVRRHSSWLLSLGLVALTLFGLRARSRARRRSAAWLAACALLIACDGGEDASASEANADAGVASPLALTREQLRDPESCKSCHPVHYREWSSSMHAYSAQDPVFIAMNKRGQRETNGELGDFCVRCHAPMAVVDGLTKDGLNLDELPDRDRGVSCYFCHNTVEVEGDHNGMLRLADDTTMRGPIRDPLDPGAHRAAYSDMFEDTNPKSSAMCGGCHDIVTPSGVHLERTLQEYRSGIFAKSAPGEVRPFDSCVGCHMPPQQGYAAHVAGAQKRSVHEHLWPGVDVALTDFPNRQAMRSAVEDCQLGTPSVSFFTLEVTPPDLFTFQIETGAGHNQPSGAAQDRRLWIEFLAYDDDGELIEEASSGNIADDEIVDKPFDDPEHDPQLAIFRDRIYDADGKPVHMFWEAEKSEAYPEGYASSTLPGATTTYISGKHAVLKQFRASGPDGLPARVTARLRMRPIGLDVLQDLVDSGDLDPEVMAQMPTFTFGSQLEWTREDGVLTTISAVPKSDCTTYRCLLNPTLDDCPK